ncbi:AGAP007651-PA-like protein [Anopheles sinensis]|uniref:AGAP007651-PA-like protein n=1 Tax=Anopheles sinensis TaxID=74873 RepID=A0A084VF98_ANOSI|nr:AGAP007651-PA-like protein [Anopheles sinensis]
MVIATQLRKASSSSSIGEDSIDAKLAGMFLDAPESAHDKIPTEQIGITVRRTLVSANHEARAIVGLSESINALSKTPDDFLFCFLATSGTDGSAPANHMHQVLLEAFCFEHDIYIIKVDSAEKLSRMLGAHRVESCALVQKGWKDIATAAEDRLVDYCEEHWDNPVKPIVKLPEK